jgi:uncharacterized protein (TIGR03435 family)
MRTLIRIRWRVGTPHQRPVTHYGQKVGIDRLTPLLEGRLDHPIVNQTGLTGEYDFKVEVEWTRPRAFPRLWRSLD